MNGRNLRAAAVSLLALPTLLLGFTPGALADTPDKHHRERTHGLWSVSTREDTVTVKFGYTRAPDKDYPHYCAAILATGEVLGADIWYSAHETFAFEGIAAGPNEVVGTCEDSDGLMRDVGSIVIDLPGPPTTHFVGTRHFVFDDEDD